MSPKRQVLNTSTESSQYPVIGRLFESPSLATLSVIPLPPLTQTVSPLRRVISHPLVSAVDSNPTILTATSTSLALYSLQCPSRQGRAAPCAASSPPPCTRRPIPHVRPTFRQVQNSPRSYGETTTLLYIANARTPSPVKDTWLSCSSEYIRYNRLPSARCSFFLCSLHVPSLYTLVSFVRVWCRCTLTTLPDSRLLTSLSWSRYATCPADSSLHFFLFLLHPSRPVPPRPSPPALHQIQPQKHNSFHTNSPVLHRSLTPNPSG